jgi:hypothetical protein
MNSQQISDHKMEGRGYSAVRAKYARTCAPIRAHNTIIKHLQADLMKYRKKYIQQQAALSKLEACFQDLVNLADAFRTQSSPFATFIGELIEHLQIASAKHG